MKTIATLLALAALALSMNIVEIKPIERADAPSGLRHAAAQLDEVD